MLSIVSESNGDVVHIHGDLAGLEALEQALRRVREQVAAGVCEDNHLFSNSWGGKDLTETMLESERETGARQVQHLKLFGWTDEWSVKHGLSPNAR